MKFYTEIAKDLGRRPQSVQYMARKLKLVRSTEALAHRYGKWNNKHSHLRADVLKYFQRHSFQETAEHFGLTLSELKSCITYAYKDPELSHLRKATNDHSPWSAKQLKFLLQHAGLRPRIWIADQIGRGNKVCIKERLQALGLASRNLQGLTLSQFIQAFGRRPEFSLLTDAGPNATCGSHRRAHTHWRIVPWVWLEQELRARRLKTGPELRILISAHAQFQEWIFEGNALSKMKRIVKKASKVGEYETTTGTAGKSGSGKKKSQR